MEKTVIKIGEISKLINGDRGKNYPSQNDIVDDGEIPFINAGHLIDNHVNFDDMNYISREKFDKLSSGKVIEGDILYCLRGSLGKKALVRNIKDGAIASSLVIIRPDKKRVSSEYLLLALESTSIKSQLVKANNGSSQPNLSAKSVSDYIIKVHSIDKQEEIIGKINKVKSIIDSRKLQLALLDDLIKSRFVEMFGDPVENTMNWKVCKLVDLSVQINSGNTPKGGEQVYVDKGITFFRSQNVWKDRLEMDDIAFIDKETHENMKRSSLKHGDILMTKTGRINTENSSLGRAALYLGEDDAANVNGHVYFIRLKPDVNNEFILKILVSNEYLGYIRSVCVGGIDKRQLNKNHIEDFPIICPPKDMQRKFIDFVHQVDKLKAEAQKSLNETQILLDSLMQKYFK